MPDLNHFEYYLEKNEEEGGYYWKFLEMDDKQIFDRINYYVKKMSEILLEVQNPQLKQKMKDRIYQYVKHTGITHFTKDGMESILTSEQMLDCLEVQIMQFCDKIANEEYGDNSGMPINTKLDMNSILMYIKEMEISDDKKFELMNKLIKAINEKDYSNVQDINAEIIYDLLKLYPNMADKLLHEYSQSIPEYFFKYLEVSKDPEYILRKAERFYKENIQIGIDPRIPLGLEIEANHRIPIKINLWEQDGFWPYREYNEPTVPVGEEIACPPIHDKPEELSKVCALIETMAEEGFYYDDSKGNAAGQINIGLEYLNSARAVANFYEIFGNCEELLFHICNAEGQLTRQPLYRNSRFKPISEIIGTRVIDEDIDRIELLKLLYPPYNKRENDEYIQGLQYKKNTVGIRDLFNSKRARLEIKISNGSVDYREWINNMRLFGKMVEMSRRLAEIQEKDDITPEEEHLLWLKENLSNPDSTLEDKLYDLMDLLFEEDEIKNIYIDRFYALEQKIKETGTKKYDYPRYEHKGREKMFGIVDFQQQYKSQIETGRVISYDPETGIYKEDGKEERI